MKSKPRNFTSVHDFSNEEFHEVFNAARIIKAAIPENVHHNDPALRRNRLLLRTVCDDIIVSMIFGEPSTRTSVSFNKAAIRIGAHPVTLFTQLSSTAKGETMHDTGKVMEHQSQVLVIRDKDKNAVSHLANVLSIPVISAGAGDGEHPTQAMLDMFTILEKFGRTDIKIGLFGDLLNGRTAHSLIMLGARMGASFACIAPNAELSMPPEYIAEAQKYGAKITLHDNPHEIAGELDVLYTTRLQRERQKNIGQDEVVKIDLKSSSGYSVDQKLLDMLPRNSILMHPMPRNDELPIELVDTDPRAVHFEQAENGIYTRMALLLKLLERPLPDNLTPVFKI